MLYLTKQILKISAKKIGIFSKKVGAAGFEPATSWSQTRRDDRTTLRPEKFAVAEGMRFELMRHLRVDSLANCSVNHSGNPPCNCFKNFFSVIASANIKCFSIFTKTFYLIFFVFLIHKPYKTQ